MKFIYLTKYEGKHSWAVLVLSGILWTSCGEKQPAQFQPESVKDVMDHVVTRLYNDLSSAQLDTIGNDFILHFLTEKEKKILASKYWYFDVNVPVIISLLRDKGQKIIPFWLKESGFKKTGMEARSEMYTYEVWQKNFDAGTVSLGINGFDEHGPTYFITVKAMDPDAELNITNIFPDNQHLYTMKTGAFTYHDWDELVLKDVPEPLVGQVLFTTIRGRAREAHLIHAFRKTPYPSGAAPDQVMLTWSGDTEKTMDIQWRSDTTVKRGIVKYWIEGSSDTLTKEADRYLMEDRLLQNDRYIYRYTAEIESLNPGTTYQYRVGSNGGAWSKVFSFFTAQEKNEKFSFIWFGDTHKSPKWGEILQASDTKFPEIAFYSIAGDLVSTGLHRDHWDEFFQYAGDVFGYKPLMPVPGNHDNQAGLGAWMFQKMFSLPGNGPEKVSPGLTYSFSYENALFLMIDATQPNDWQTAWIEEQLAGSNAIWKFAMFHFPPYNYEEDYADIRRLWCTLFDKYHVDMVFSGHTHYYMRSKPMNKEKVVSSPAEGTVYVISVGIPGDHKRIPPQYYSESADKKGWRYQHIELDGNVLRYQSLDVDGNVKDSMIIKK